MSRDESVTTPRVIFLMFGVSLLAFAGCSFGPHVVGPAHTSVATLKIKGSGRSSPLSHHVSGKGVVTYFLPPTHYRVVARLDATGYGSVFGNGWHVGMDYRVIERLRRQAKRLGANGVLLEQRCGVSCVIKSNGHASAPLPADFRLYRAEAIRVTGPACPFPTRLCDWLEPSHAVAEQARNPGRFFSSDQTALTTPSLPQTVLGQSVGQLKQIHISCRIFSGGLSLFPSHTPTRIEARVGRNGQVETVRIIQMGRDRSMAGPTLALAHLLGVIRRWRFQPLMIQSKPHAFDFLILLKSIGWEAWHQKHVPYICQDNRVRAWAPTWYVYLPKPGSNALPLAVAMRHHVR